MIQNIFSPKYYTMKTKIILCFAVFTIIIAGCATINPPNRGRETETEVEVNFSERQTEKYLNQYVDQLDLSRRQQRQIAKVNKKYNKKADKLTTLQIGKKRALQKEKGEALLNILEAIQVEKLNQLTGKKGLFKKLTE